MSSLPTAGDADKRTDFHRLTCLMLLSSSTQCVNLLSEHDLVPVLGTPRPAPVLGGSTGTVSSSFLVREADILAPGSLLIIATGEGYAPEEVGPCVTVAREMANSVEKGWGVGHGSSANGAGSCRGLTRIASGDGKGTIMSRMMAATNFSDHDGADDRLMVDGEEVLVEVMDAETGLCLGRRIPIGELRHSTSFFGRKLDMKGSAAMQVSRKRFLAPVFPVEVYCRVFSTPAAAECEFTAWKNLVILPCLIS